MSALTTYHPPGIDEQSVHVLIVFMLHQRPHLPHLRLEAPIYMP